MSVAASSTIAGTALPPRTSVCARIAPTMTIASTRAPMPAKRRHEQQDRAANLQHGGEVTEPLSESEGVKHLHHHRHAGQLGQRGRRRTPRRRRSAEPTATTFFFIVLSFSSIDDTYMHYMAKN